MEEMEFYKMAYQGLDELAQKVVEAKDYAATKYNNIIAAAQKPAEPEKTPTPKKEK